MRNIVVGCLDGSVCNTQHCYSPLGRGRFVRRFWAPPATEFAKPTCADTLLAETVPSPRGRGSGRGETTLRQPPSLGYPEVSSVAPSRGDFQRQIFTLHLRRVFLRCILQLETMTSRARVGFSRLLVCGWLVCGAPMVFSADSAAPGTNNGL